MNKKKKVSFLVGAGFSKAAVGLPLVSELSTRILNETNNRHYYNTSLNMWFDGDRFDPVRDFDVAIIRPVFHQFLKEPHSFNYEEFYSKLEREKPNFWRQAQEFIKYRVKSELDISNQQRPNWILEFKDFLINTVNGGSTVNIASLNHDLFLERLLSDVDLFSDGFVRNSNDSFKVKKTENPNEPDRDISVPIFGDKNWKRLNLLKLHGSIDLFSVGNDEIFFKYDSIPFRGTDNRVNFNPIFVTGEKSHRLYEKNNYVKLLIKKLSRDLLETAVLFVVGYGFGDKKINEIFIEKCFEQRVIVVIIDNRSNLPIGDRLQSQLNSSIDFEGLTKKGRLYIHEEGFEDFFRQGLFDKYIRLSDLPKQV